MSNRSRDPRFGGEVADVLPMSLGVVRGVRDFTWNRSRNQWMRLDPPNVMTGVSVPYPWHQGENIASCIYKKDSSFTSSNSYINTMFKESVFSARPEHRPPGRECTCGFYAYFGEDNGVERAYSDFYTVAGIIEGYGVVEFGDLGFRCEKARIVALINPHVNHMDSDDFEKMKSTRSIAPALYKRLMKFFTPLNIITLLVVLLAISNSHSDFYLPEWTEPIIDWWVLLYTLVYMPLFAASAVKTLLLKKREKRNQFLSQIQDQVEQFRSIRDSYPDIPQYRSLEEAEEDYPLTTRDDLRQ